MERLSGENGSNAGVAYAVQTAVNGGSELLIFVRLGAHSQTRRSAIGCWDLDAPDLGETKTRSDHGSRQRLPSLPEGAF
jgi:hypothetical protein